MVRACAIASSALCLLLLLPSLLLAYAGTGWLDLDPPAFYSAAALVIGPLPVALGAFFAWKAAREASPSHLCTGLVFLFLSLPVYGVAFGGGGRMLI